MTRYAQAAILKELGRPLIIGRIEIPALLYGQVLVKILYSGVCRSQLMEVRGGRGEDPWLPHLLGHEASGVVVAVGEGVTKVAPNDAVILGWVRGGGIDAEGAKYTSDIGLINSGKVSTFSNYTVVSESRVVIKPETLSFENAVLFGCALPTGAGMILKQIKPSPSDSIVIVGLGGVGIAALLASVALGLRKIIAVDISDDKLSFAKRLGADEALNSQSDGFFDELMKLTNGGADYCVEAGGSIATIEMGFSLIRKDGGQLLFASHPRYGEMIKLNPHELISGKKISGSWGGGIDPDVDIPKIYSTLKKCSCSFEILLEKRYMLEEINDAIDDLEHGKVFRPLIVMEH